jgi:glycosyltransferase involved in cell wall biosynthesis
MKGRARLESLLARVPGRGGRRATKPSVQTLGVGKPNVLFLSHESRPSEGSRLYRCVYQAKQLAAAGMGAAVVFYEDATPELLASADVLILSRCQYNKKTLEIVQQARKRGQLLLGDLDDKIFAPWDVDSTGYLRSKVTLTRDLRVTARVTGTEYRVLQMMALMDAVLVSTPALRDELAELGIPAHVARNAFDTDVNPGLSRERKALRRLLIMAGTRTHDADLRLIAEPLGRFLQENPGIGCALLGPLEPPGSLRGLTNVERVELLPVDKLYAFVAQFDLCLVPLENTPFNDCKSALKYVECGLVSVPVLASERREYRELVEDGRNGFLASDDAQSWYSALGRLHDEPGLITNVARAAHRDVLANHTVQGRGHTLAELMKRLHQDFQRTQRADGP